MDFSGRLLFILFIYLYVYIHIFFFWPYIVIYYYVSLYLYEYITYKKKKMYIRVIYSLDVLSSTVAVFNMAKRPFSSLCMIYYCFLFGRPVSSDDRFGLSRNHLFTIKIIITTCNGYKILYRSLQLESTENNCK